MLTQPPAPYQRAALLLAGFSCSALAFGSWSPAASAHPHVPGAPIVPHSHEEVVSPKTANPALWLAGLSCALLAIPASRRLVSQG